MVRHSKKIRYTAFCICNRLYIGFSLLVRVTGLEPAHLSAQEPKSCVSASFTTSAFEQLYHYILKKEIFIIQKNHLLV